MDIQDVLNELRTNKKLKYWLENRDKKLIYTGYYTDEQGNKVIRFWEED